MERPPIFPIQGGPPTPETRNPKPSGIGPGRKSMSYGVAALGLAFLVMQTRGFSKEQKAELSKELGTLVNLAPLPVAAKKGGGAVAADPAPWEVSAPGARPVHLLLTMIKWIRTSRLSIKNSLSAPQRDPISFPPILISQVMRHRRTWLVC